MSKAQVIYWRDIPTQVVIGSGRKAIKRPLADRFLVAVDKAAMADNVTSDDQYLEDWRKVDADAPGADPQDSAEQLAKTLEESYPASRLAELARRGGKETLN